MSVSPSVAELSGRLSELTLRDERRLRRRLDGAKRIPDQEKRRSALASVAADVETANARVERRRGGVPTLGYPPELPLTERKDDILAAIRDHQVVIVAGETGSGKTTQLPKICLELGRGIRGMIGHTQPRRLAARTVAERIAAELDVPLGDAIGYQVRFTDRASDDTLVKLMTDGILLAEIQNDRMLRRYDTLIIDEAHERSLNIDFILGYLKQLLPQRPDLKVIITSATIDPERFAEHFGDAVAVGADTSSAEPISEQKRNRAAPIVEVSGRTYPVEVRYRPVVDPDDPSADPDRDQIKAICDAVDELRGEASGDILVFLSGEREIRDTADALKKAQERRARPLEVLPLYARLSAAEQHRVFQPHNTQRVVLSTNVAETSLTVPGIKYVIDPGMARISRYSLRTKVQRLPIEKISQASANQRKGRCGRTSDGICVRLYTEDDFDARPEFTDPEILRTNLASVILQMAAAELGEIGSFGFIDPPDKRAISDGISLLHELGALDLTEKEPRRQLTSLGRKLAGLPIDPRLARMVLEADRNGCVREVLLITSALSIQDPRERPADAQQAADEKHARFANDNSDFLALLTLWEYLKEQQRELSSSKFRRMCRSEFLNYLRVREWQDIYGQLRQITKSLGITVNTADGPAANPDLIHQSLLAGLLSQIGLQDSESKGEDRSGGKSRGKAEDRPGRRGSEFLGARGARFVIFPGSRLARRPPHCVMAGELVETSRLWGRTVAKIDPAWIEPLAGHLVKRTYSEPHWEQKRGAVMAYEKVTLYGIPIVVERKITYGRIDPELSRDLFIRHALVQGEWKTHHKFFHENHKLLDDVEGLEDRVRRRDILVDDETLFDFYDQRVGEEVVSARHFDTWWKQERREKPDLLTFTPDMLVNDRVVEISEQDYPDQWTHGELDLPLRYAFDPGTTNDGVTIDVPLPILNQVGGDLFSWQVPGLREELLIALIRTLPKQIRKSFVPAPNFAKAILENVGPADGPLLETVERELERLTGVRIARESWRLDHLPDHLRMTFRVTDDNGETVATGKDLVALKTELTQRTRSTLSEAARGLERSGLRTWDFGPLPKTYLSSRGAHEIKAYPAIADDRTSVSIRMCETEEEQRRTMWAGTRRLLMLNAPPPIKLVHTRLDNRAKLTLSHSPHGSVTALLEDCASCAVDALIEKAGGPAWDEPDFHRLSERVRSDLSTVMVEVVKRVERILAVAQEVERALNGRFPPTMVSTHADVKEQFRALIHPGFVTATGMRRLRDVERYLRAIGRRLEKAPLDPHRDRARTLDLQRIRGEYDDLVKRYAPADPPPEVLAIRWMLEELRVSFFAQQLGTAYPVSEQRIFRAMDDLAT